MIICIYSLVSDMPKQKYKSHFQDIWLKDEQFKQWVQIHPNLVMTKCKICKKDISVGSVGVKALSLHADGVKHEQRMPKNDRSSMPLTQNPMMTFSIIMSRN